MSDNGVTFAGNGSSELSHTDVGDTRPPKGSSGSKSGGVTFAGSGMDDVNVSTDDTTQHDASKHDIDQSGRGVEFVS